MSVTFEGAATVPADRETVYDLLMDADRYSEWLPGFVSNEIIEPGRDGDHLGRRWRETRKLMGHQGTEHFELVAGGLDQGKRHAQVRSEAEPHEHEGVGQGCGLREGAREQDRVRGVERQIGDRAESDEGCRRWGAGRRARRARRARR